MNNKITVPIDQYFKIFIPKYLETMKKAIGVKGEISQALEKNDFKTIQGWAHQIKTSGPGYGFYDIGVTGEKIDQSSENQDKKKIQYWLNELMDYLERVEPKYIEMDTEE
jgi:HPt (histidine-containing phosphotransfer) domain-containing protein